MGGGSSSAHGQSKRNAASFFFGCLPPLSSSINIGDDGGSGPCWLADFANLSPPNNWLCLIWPLSLSLRTVFALRRPLVKRGRLLCESLSFFLLPFLSFPRSLSVLWLPQSMLLVLVVVVLLRLLLFPGPPHCWSLSSSSSSLLLCSISSSPLGARGRCFLGR